MAAILIHMVLILDLTGCQNVPEAIERFLQQGDLAGVNPEVDIRGQRCTIRYTVAGPETLTGLRQKLKHMAKGLFSDATQAALQNLKHRPDEFTVAGPETLTGLRQKLKHMAKGLFSDATQAAPNGVFYLTG